MRVFSSEGSASAIAEVPASNLTVGFGETRSRASPLSATCCRSKCSRRIMTGRDASLRRWTARFPSPWRARGSRARLAARRTRCARMSAASSSPCTSPGCPGGELAAHRRQKCWPCFRIIYLLLSHVCKRHGMMSDISGLQEEATVRRGVCGPGLGRGAPAAAAHLRQGAPQSPYDPHPSCPVSPEDICRREHAQAPHLPPITLTRPSPIALTSHQHLHRRTLWTVQLTLLLRRSCSTATTRTCCWRAAGPGCTPCTAGRWTGPSRRQRARPTLSSSTASTRAVRGSPEMAPRCHAATRSQAVLELTRLHILGCALCRHLRRHFCEAAQPRHRPSRAAPCRPAADRGSPPGLSFGVAQSARPRPGGVSGGCVSRLPVSQPV